MKSISKLIKPATRFELDEKQGRNEKRNKLYWLILRVSSAVYDAVSRQKFGWATGLARWQRRTIKPVWAHCDLMCGVYDPAQARIEAESVLAIMNKYQASDDEVFKQRCIIIKEQRAQLAKEHLWVLWTDYFKPEHIEKWPQLHDLFWRATKKAGEAKKTVDPKVGEELLNLIAEISDIFDKTKS